MGRSRGPLRRLEATLLLGVAPLVRRLPPRVAMRLGRALGRLVHRVDAHHRKLARRNVQSALHVSPAEASRIVREVFAHFGRVTIEVLALPRSLREPERFRIEGWEHLERAHALGRGVLIYSAHMGNWELFAQQQALRGFPIDFIARPLDNPWLDEAFTRWRELPGNRVLAKHGALRLALKTLKSKRSLAILIDQNQRVPPRLFVPFFGTLAATTPTLGMLAVRTGAPVVPAVSIPHEDGGYTFRYEAPLLVPAEGTDEARADAVTLAATQLLERWIRAQPHTWLWLHDRWKGRPGAGERVLS